MCNYGYFVVFYCGLISRHVKLLRKAQVGELIARIRSQIAIEIIDAYALCLFFLNSTDNSRDLELLYCAVFSFQLPLLNAYQLKKLTHKPNFHTGECFIIASH